VETAKLVAQKWAAIILVLVLACDPL